jgi:hypothetical protein
MKSLIGDDQVFIDYSRNDIPSLHEKNLFELGEDRMLTTLLLQRFPGMSLSFVPEAICWTIVPHNMNILMSQRRRWINSTFHNMYELLKVQTMCGLCFMSMKTVVIMDLIVTMILPASLIYVAYLIYLFISQPESIDRFVLIVYAVSFCFQMLSFLFRSRYDYILWFFMFIVLGIPVFYFILPIYAFTHMDDFSWGKTRQVGVVKDDTEGEGDKEGEEDEEDSSSDPNGVRVNANVSAGGQSRGAQSFGGPASYGQSARGPPSQSMGQSYGPGSQGGSFGGQPGQSFAGPPSHHAGSFAGPPSHHAGQSFGGPPSHQGQSYGAPPSYASQSYGGPPPHGGQMYHGGPPPQYADDQSYAGQSYAGQSLGASTIQTNRTHAHGPGFPGPPGHHNQRLVSAEELISIPDGFSVGRGSQHPQQQHHDMAPHQPPKKDYDAYRNFL